MYRPSGHAVKEPGIDNPGPDSVVFGDKESHVKDNIAWLVELFLLVLVLCGAVGLGLVSTMQGSLAAGILGDVLFLICIAVGVFFTAGQDERLRTFLFGAYVGVSGLLFIFVLTLQGVVTTVLSPLLSA